MSAEILQLFRLVGIGLTLMLPLANPLASMSLLLALGAHMPDARRKRQIRLGACYVTSIMLVAYYSGTWIMRTFDISIPGMRIAGGLIVSFLGFKMLFPSAAATDIPETGKKKAEQSQENSADIAFVPLAFPGTAGPGSIAIVISLASKLSGKQDAYAHWVLAAAPVIVAVLLGLLFWICLRSSTQLVRFLGNGSVEAISRVMGFLLVCMGVQFVIDGTLEVVAASAH
ncbi:MarC family NAAT transporter [Cupriavidus sp. WS]|uniref:MarC family NAAT transporter n=1 Tax=Cupriavidus sp. WS TaxID=1312922 RepID=UPI00039FA49D|nr:MarC family NAAT transporter [Cupriavidus sp. WS]